MLKRKPAFVVVIFFFVILQAKAQSANSLYFVTGSDTVFCTSLEYGTSAQGYLNNLEYTDLTGKNVLLHGRKEVPDVSTFHMGSIVYDKVPLKAHQPDSYIRYTERVVDGKLKVYLSQQNMVTTYNTLDRVKFNPPVQVNSGHYQPGGSSLVSSGIPSSGHSGLYRFYLKMPDGKYYKINKSGNVKKIIRPYLENCEDFVKAYKGDYSTREKPFMEMIELYNTLCK